MNKYHAKKVKWNGLTFDSKKELKRYQELLLLQRAGEIRDLSRQVDFELIPAQYIGGKCVERKCSYKADFTYRKKDGQFVIEDTKGMKTADYIIKRKLVLQRYGYRITET